jgi:hypothetical protein
VRPDREELLGERQFTVPIYAEFGISTGILLNYFRAFTVYGSYHTISLNKWEDNNRTSSQSQYEAIGNVGKAYT